MAPESSRMNCFSGGASALLTPTQIAPRRIAPWNAATTSTSFGSDAATRSPGRTPMPASAPAASRAQRVEFAVGEARRSGDEEPRAGSARVENLGDRRHVSTLCDVASGA